MWDQEVKEFSNKYVEFNVFEKKKEFLCHKFLYLLVD